MKTIIEPIDPLHEDAISLLHEAAREIHPLYNGGQDPNSNLPTNEPLSARSTYLIARVDGKPIGCAALRPLDEVTAELRRMYVLPSFRGQGIARKLIQEIEQLAIEFKYTTIRLETGNRQPQAVALYEACGYRQIEAFGPYVGDPTSICFEKQLPGLEKRRCMSPVRMAKIESGMRIVLDFNEAFNHHDVPKIAELLRDDCIFETTNPAPDGSTYKGKGVIIEYLQGFFQRSPQAHMEIEEIFGMGMHCIMRWKYTWGDGHVRGVDVFKIEDNLICEKLSYVKG